jgi:hypothetical protein
MWRKWKPPIFEDQKSLQEIRFEMPVDPIRVPFIVWLVENPKSPFSLPGWTDINIHDYMHIILGQDLSNDGEAFVIGFCMGNNRKTKMWHVKIFKFISSYLYPKHYKFNFSNLLNFDLGFNYGRSLKYKNINESKFDNYKFHKLEWVRKVFGIDKYDLRRFSCR